MEVTMDSGAIHFPANPWFIGGMFLLTFMWLVLVFVFFPALRSADSERYLALGKPSFTSRGAMFKVMGYIYSRAHRHLARRGFSFLCDTMCVVFLLIVVGFIIFLTGHAGAPVDI